VHKSPISAPCGTAKAGASCHGLSEDLSRVTENLSRITEKFWRATKNLSRITGNFSRVTKNLSRITENLSSVIENVSGITKNLSRVTENPSRATENLSLIAENLSRVSDLCFGTRLRSPAVVRDACRFIRTLRLGAFGGVRGAAAHRPISAPCGTAKVRACASRYLGFFGVMNLDDAEDGGSPLAFHFDQYLREQKTAEYPQP
jgi:hypothetical protein